MSANPPRAPGELAEIKHRAFAESMRAWGENDPNPEWFADDCLSMMLADCGRAGALIDTLLDEIASLRSATGDGGEAMRRPIVEYPYEQVGEGSDRWGPEAVLYVPARDDFYPHHEVSYVGHLEAGMWLVRDPEGPCGWGELPVPPSHFILLPPRDDANRLDLQPRSTKIEGADDNA